MQINTVKENGTGYLVNGSLYVPNDENSPYFKLVKEWELAGGVVEPELTQAQLEYKMISNFKSLYLNRVQEVLASKDYDSLATVKLWEGDATYGEEAAGIINWYKSVIAYNYQLLADVKAGTVAIPDDATYLAGIPAYI